jgi:predicted permease
MAWRDRADAFTALAATTVGPIAHVPSGSGLKYVRAWQTTADLFDVLRVRPVVGRVFTGENELVGRNAVAVISYGLWQRNFGGDPSIVGTSIHLANPRRSTEVAGLVEIIGVVPNAFNYPPDIQPDVWIPHVAASGPPRIDARYLRVIGRLREGVTIQQAQRQVESITSSVAAENGFPLRGDWRPVLVSFYDTLVDDVRGWMLLVLCTVGLVVVIACVNVATLMLTRSAKRARDLAIRASLGASPTQLSCGLLVESVMLSMAAAALGIVLAYWALDLAKAALPRGIPRADDIAINLRVLAAALSAAVAAGVFFGIVPAWQAARVQPSTVLSQGCLTVTAGVRRWHAAFVVAEVAFVGTLLMISTLFVSSFVRVVRTDLGFARQNLISLGLDASPGSNNVVREALRGTAGVASIAEVSGSPPLVTSAYPGTYSVVRTRLERLASANDAASVQPTIYRISPEYFDTAGIQVLRGRTFTEAEASEPVAIIDEIIAALLFADGQDPIGARLSSDSTLPPLTVVGVVRTVSHDGPEATADPQLYLPKSIGTTGTTHYLIRTSRRVADVIPRLQGSLRRALPPDSQLPPIRSLEEAFRTMTAGRRANATLMSLFGVIALLIGGAGVYAVMASTVVQQEREVGVRVALGATKGQIMRGVVARAVAYVAGGLGIGLLAGNSLSGFFESLLFQVRPSELSSYVIVAALLLMVGLVAALVPAVRAANVDPIVILRRE